KEIKERLSFLLNVGLNYVTLNRSANTLSGGEGQRIRLATQIGSSLSGVIYVLDEPSIGLHPRDNTRLIKTLTSLRDLGNTVLVVEHDEETIRAADYIVDMGVGAGVHGGEVVAKGSYEEIIANKLSLTGKFLSGEEKIDMKINVDIKNGDQASYRSNKSNNIGNNDKDIERKLLTIKGVNKNNIKNQDFSIPL
ncbi:MAG: excinuclease ABC subunit UvrA, partial [Oligoflexia bacterium]|nr:excinuclease ABC subunit UvrA [Oligoflexia bacterium]